MPASEQNFVPVDDVRPGWFALLVIHTVEACKVEALRGGDREQLLMARW